MRSVVYKAIKDRLKEAKPELEYIDLQKGQFLRMTENYPIPLPACLIELKPVSWSNIVEGQLGDAIVSFSIFMENVTDSFDGSETEHESIEMLDAQDELYDIMEGFSGEGFSPLCRKGEAAPLYDKRFVMYTVNFQTEFTSSHVKEMVLVERPEVNFKFK